MRRPFLDMLAYNVFLPNVSHILHPLNHLLQKNAHWAWKSKHWRAFDAAKRLLRTLVHYDVNICQSSYMSAYGLGACLVQIIGDGSQKLIVYASWTPSKPKKSICIDWTWEFTLVFGACHFYQYLHDHPFILVTDHCPLCKSCGSKQGTYVYLKWLTSYGNPDFWEIQMW